MNPSDEYYVVEVFRWVPFLAILEKRKDLLPSDPTKMDQKMREFIERHVRKILSGKGEPEPVTPGIFFHEANVVAFSPSEVVWRRFAEYYARLSVRAFVSGHPLLDKHYPPVGGVPVPEFLSVPRPFPELKLYHVEVADGVVSVNNSPLYRASLLYRDILRWLRDRVVPIVRSGFPEEFRDFAMKVLSPPSPRKGRYPFIKKLLSASGLPDGRKRILFYWLIPYWVTVERREPNEVLELANQWISRQGGGKIYSSWILSEAENVRSKGIKPWSISKVERVDPELIKLLRGMGVL